MNGSVDVIIIQKKVFVVLLLIILTLLVADLLGIYMKFTFENKLVEKLVPLFDFDAEGNIPTLFSSIILFISSGLLLIISSAHKRLGSSYLSWMGLAVIFLFLSIDETVGIHEQVASFIRNRLHTTGIFYYAWVIPYGILVLVLLAVYFRFLMNLPKKIMIMFLVSGSLYIAGAIGFEILGSLEASKHAEGDIVFSLLVACEESFEMLGISLFIYALLEYISTYFDKFIITLAPASTVKEG